MADAKELATWLLIGLAALLLLASFTGSGTGMFGWGWMMGMMWIWMLWPVLLVVLLIVLLQDRSTTGDQDPPREPRG